MSGRPDWRSASQVAAANHARAPAAPRRWAAGRRSAWRRNADDRWSTAARRLLRLQGDPLTRAEPWRAAPGVPAYAGRTIWSRLWRCRGGAGWRRSRMGALRCWAAGRDDAPRSPARRVLSVLLPDGTTLDPRRSAADLARRPAPGARRDRRPRGGARSTSGSRSSLAARPLPDTDGSVAAVLVVPMAAARLLRARSAQIASPSPAARRTRSRAPLPRGGSWSRDDVILSSAPEPNASAAACAGRRRRRDARAVRPGTVRVLRVPDVSPRWPALPVHGGQRPEHRTPPGFPIRLGSLDSADATRADAVEGEPAAWPRATSCFGATRRWSRSRSTSRTLRLSGLRCRLSRRTAFNPITNQGSVLRVRMTASSPISARRPARR